MLVLEDHRYGDLLGQEILLGYVRFHALSALDPVGRIGFAAIDEEEIFLDKSLHEATADPEPPGGQPVDAFPGLCRVYFEDLYGLPLSSGRRSPHSRRRRKRLALKMRLSECSSSLSKNCCDLLSSASDGSSRSTSDAASVTGASSTASVWSVSSCTVDGSTSGSATSGSSDIGTSVSDSTAVGCSSAADPISWTSESPSAGSRTSSPESVSCASGGSGTMPAAAIASAVTIASSADRASSWAASRTTAIDSVSRRSRREVSISLAEVTSMFSITSV